MAHGCGRSVTGMARNGRGHQTHLNAVQLSRPTKDSRKGFLSLLNNSDALHWKSICGWFNINRKWGHHSTALDQQRNVSPGCHPYRGSKSLSNIDSMSGNVICEFLPRVIQESKVTLAIQSLTSFLCILLRLGVIL
jgi:hypothetical protein